MTALDPAAPAASAAPPASARLPWLDDWRGIAIVAMVVYHFGWDLSTLGYIVTDVSTHPVWSLFARSIAASFLTIAGISLVKAHEGGMRWSAFWRRLGLIAGAAALVTVGTLIVFPEGFVVFGILHCIAASSLIALPFLRWRWPVAALAALAVAALPLMANLPALAPLQASLPGQPGFGLVQLLGLTTTPPDSVDFVPLFPWLAFLLGGVALGKLVGSRAPAPAGPISHPSAPFRALRFLGRHSLLIYLIHQPILFGGLTLLAQALPQLTQAPARPDFLSECVATCTITSDETTCRRGCACVQERVAADPELERGLIAQRRSDAALQAALAPIVEACMRPR